ncbi:unnamed protein product, partial [Ixodes pacificus]
MREVVGAYKFLRARFSLEYLSEVTRKKLYQDLVDVTLPVPLYRALYSTGSGQDVLKRVKRMSVPACVKTFFSFKLHTGTLPVKTWMVERGMFVAWGNHCFLCKKPESVEHVFLDCWDAIFFWDLLQRTLKKDFPLDSHGIRFQAVENENCVPFDLFMLLGLHSIWRCRMAVRHADVDTRPVGEYFSESVRYIIEVWKVRSSVPEWLPTMEKLLNVIFF